MAPVANFLTMAWSVLWQAALDRNECIQAQFELGDTVITGQVQRCRAVIHGALQCRSGYRISIGG